MLHEKKVNVIYSGINTATFNFIDPISARNQLLLPLDRKIILLGANDLSYPTKGLAHSINVLRKIDTNILIVTFGNGVLDAGLPHEIINLGFINDKHKMAQLYAAADLFLATSVAEAFGMTLAEAQCCGTPVVAFNSGGPIDIIEHKVSGYLSNYPEVEDLENGILYVLHSTLNRAEISSKACEKFSILNSARQYQYIYNELSNSTPIN